MGAIRRTEFSSSKISKAEGWASLGRKSFYIGYVELVQGDVKKAGRSMGLKFRMWKYLKIHIWKHEDRLDKDREKRIIL